MSMLARFAASGGAQISYADISAVESGSSLGGTASGITFNDILPNDVVMLFIADAASATYTVPAGYVLGASGVITGTYRYAWYYKVMGSTPDTGINLNDSNADGSGFTYYVCRGVDTSNPIMSAPSPFAGNNPPAVTTTRKSLVFAAVFGGNNTNANYTAAPTGYSGFQTIDATANSDADVASGWKAVSSATTEDPGAFTAGTAFSSQISVTIALNPAVAAGGIIGSIPTFVSSAANSSSSATSLAVTPTGIQAGDLLVAIIVPYTTGSISTTAVVSSVPSGFKILAQRRSSGIHVATRVSAGVGGTYTFGITSGGAGFSLCMLVYRGATTINTIGDGSLISTGAISTAPSMYSSYRGVLISYYSLRASGRTITTEPSGLTQRLYSNTSYSQAAYELSTQEVGESVDYNLTWSATGDTKVALQLQITNEPDIAPTFIDVADRENSGTSLSITRPANTAAGDLMIAILNVGGGTTSGWTGPADWTEVADNSAGRPVSAVYYKIANTSEAASYSFTSAVSRNLAGVILTYRNANYLSIGSFASGANPLYVQSPWSTYSQSMIIDAVGNDVASNTITAHMSTTTRFTDNSANRPSYVICDQVVPRGDPGTRNFTLGTATNVNGVSLIIRPTGSY